MKAFWKLSGISEKSENGGKSILAFYFYLYCDIIGSEFFSYSHAFFFFFPAVLGIKPSTWAC
jgi:hypothetical protein